MTENNIETLLTVAEVAGLLKLQEQTIRRWILRREIPFCKVGKAVRFRPSVIARWVDGGGAAVMAEEVAEEEGETGNDGL